MTEKVEEVKPTQFNETLKLASFAATGGRKTLQIGYLIDLVGVENVGIINADRGLTTIKSKTDDRYVKTVDSRDDLRAAWAWARDNFAQPHQWVVIDGGTRVLNWVQQEIFSGAQAALDGMIAGIPRGELKDVRKYASYVSKELDLNTQQMWWQTGQQCERLLDSFVKLGSNMYWTFWERQTSLSQFQKGPPWKPDTPGTGALEAVKRAFDFIFRLVSDGDQVTAYFRNPAGSSLNYGKVRDDWDGGIKVPNSIANFRMDEFVKLISGEGSSGPAM